jgi:tRNA(Ile)-lysidine synthase
MRPVGTVRAIHVDHGWSASAELRRAATAIAERLELPFEIVAVTPASGPSREGAAREVRLAALAEAAKGERIITGHHADDAAETVIANLLRGAGMTGLSGIAPTRLPFVRPLIGFRRDQLRRLAEGLGLPFVDDPANDDLAFRRNLVRHRVLPDLDAKIDGDLVEVLGRTARHLAAEDAYIDEIVPQLVLVEDAGASLLAIAPLVTLSPVLARRSVRMALRQVHPPYPGTAREVGVVMSVLSGEKIRGDLSGGLVAEREGPFVAIFVPASAEPPSLVDLPLPGAVVFGTHEIVASRAADGRRTHLSHDRCRLSLHDPDLTIRAARPGDRIDIVGGTKAVADALGEAAIPQRKRSAWPVVESRGRIAWVAGVRRAHWAHAETSATNWVELERRDA